MTFRLVIIIAYELQVGIFPSPLSSFEGRIIIEL
jgi:hypothetical protein